MEVEYGLVIVKYRCPHCFESAEDYPKASIFNKGYDQVCPYCEKKFKMRAMK